jgi:hypothetical protein
VAIRTWYLAAFVGGFTAGLLPTGEKYVGAAAFDGIVSAMLLVVPLAIGHLFLAAWHVSLDNDNVQYPWLSLAVQLFFLLTITLAFTSNSHDVERFGAWVVVMNAILVLVMWSTFWPVFIQPIRRFGLFGQLVVITDENAASKRRIELRRILRAAETIGTETP